MRQINFNLAKEKIVSFIKNKVEETKLEGVVVGLSGGIDSTVTCYLCVEALGSKNVLALIMPDLRVTPQEDVDDASEVADELSIKKKVIDIAPIHRTFMKFLEPNLIAEGNLRARIRMSLLYYHANLTNRLVCGTGDKSELLLGYFTKYGDGGVDLLPLGDLYKTEVRRLGEILGVNRKIVSKQSSPRLWYGQTAESEIGLSYEKIDTILISYFEDNYDMATISKKFNIPYTQVEKIIDMCKNNEHKRKQPEICSIV